MGAINSPLGRQLVTYAKEDPSPGRVRPLPVSILHCMESVAKSGSPRDQAIADLAWIAFFFLLRPGEYYAGGTDTVTTPFNLRDIQFLVGNQPTQSTTSFAATCAAATFVSLLFTKQKNGIKGEPIGHGKTGHPRACAVASIRRRVAHLRQHVATPDTHLAAVFNGTTWSTVCSAEITAALRAATTLMRPQVGFTPEDVGARSMRAGGAMDLLMTRFDTDTIRLVGRWRSNVILCYLHTTAQTFTEGLTLHMVQHGGYALVPHAHGD